MADARDGTGKLQGRTAWWHRARACLRRVLRQASALAGRLRSVPGTERKVSPGLLSGVAYRVGPAQPECSCRRATRVGISNGSRTVRTIPALPQGEWPKGAAPSTGGA